MKLKKQNSEIFLGVLTESFLTWINDQLRTAKQGQGLSVGFVRHLRIPDLGGAAAVHAGREAGKRPFAGSAQKVALELDGGEAFRPFRQVAEGPVAAGRIRDGDDYSGMQVAVGGQQFWA